MFVPGFVVLKGSAKRAIILEQTSNVFTISCGITGQNSFSVVSRKAVLVSDMTGQTRSGSMS